ncbi:MAG: SseB family protein, partial [Holdemanella sp.]|nr:SseB family protein [Holdemanella sp.]
MENEFYNEHVKKALENISKGKTNESLGQLAASLYATSLLIPVIWDKAPKVNKEEQYVFEPNTRFQFPLVRNEQKNSFLILFTSMEEYKKTMNECNNITYKDAMKYR